MAWKHFWCFQWQLPIQTLQSDFPNHRLRAVAKQHFTNNFDPGCVLMNTHLILTYMIAYKWINQYVQRIASQRMLRLGSSKKSLHLSLTLNNTHAVLLRNQNLYYQNLCTFWKSPSTRKLFCKIKTSRVFFFFPIWLLRKRVRKKCFNPNKISSKLPCFVLHF